MYLLIEATGYQADGRPVAWEIEARDATGEECSFVVTSLGRAQDVAAQLAPAVWRGRPMREVYAHARAAAGDVGVRSRRAELRAA
jgi:hypothetical protein